MVQGAEQSSEFSARGGGAQAESIRRVVDELFYGRGCPFRHDPPALCITLTGASGDGILGGSATELGPCLEYGDSLVATQHLPFFAILRALQTRVPGMHTAQLEPLGGGGGNAVLWTEAGKGTA